MENVTDFFKYRIDREQRDKIPQRFIGSLVDWYDYGVVSEVRESLYFYNEAKISEDILHFLTAINYELGTKAKCPWTGKTIEVTLDFWKEMTTRITGIQYKDADVKVYVRDMQRRYTQIVAQGQQKEITKTKLYQELFANCVKNLKDKALQPFMANKSFPEAVKAFGTEEFETFDSRLKEHVTYMIDNLVKKFGYTERGAKEICLYVVEQKLTEKFAT